jgi:tetratricopeptide (TPR) repeat protein
MRNLGVTYLTIDNLEKAEPLLQEGLKLSRRTLGSGHSDTLSFLGNMGDLREAQGRLDEAETYLREAVEIGQRTCAPDDQNLPYLMNSLAKVLLTRDKLDEAVHIYEEALSAFKRALHPGHPHITSAQDMLDYAIEMKARSELESANKLEAGDER